MPLLRSLRRTPGFTVTSILILGLGIGLATAVFSVAHTMLLRRLPVHDQDRIIALWGENQARTFLNFPLQIKDARQFARDSRTLESTAFFAYEGAWTTPIRDGDRLIPLALGYVSGNYFSMLGARPLLGRALQTEDDVVGADPVVVLSHAAWQRHFGGDAAVLGRRLELHVTGMRYRIVGVMPPGLDYPRGTDLWSPIVPAFAKRGTLEDGDVDLVGRLRPGVPVTAARDELSAFFRREPYNRWGGTVTAVATGFPRLVTGEVRPALLVFSLATALLLLITCINVANLLLVRGLARARELTVRAALGAQRSRIVGQMLGENAVLALGGGLLGVLVARGAVQAFTAFAPAGLPRVGPIGIDGTALAAALAITLGALLLFGLLPAVASSRVDLLAMLRSGLRQGGSQGKRRAAEGLVTAQVALAVLVLAAAGLLGRSLLKLERAELSFEPSRLVIGALTVRVDAIDNREKQVAMVNRVTDAVRALPGVVAVSPVNAVPFSGSGGWDGRPSVVGQSEQDSQSNPMLNLEVVTPDYFQAFDMPVVRGRSFTDQDREGAPKVIMLSESAARYFWPKGDAIGKRMFMMDTASVIGIVRDTRYRELRTARASIYYPFAQSVFPFAPTTLAIRTAVPAAGLIPQLRRTLDAVDPAVAVERIAPFESYLEAPLAQPRFNALLLGVFAVGALVLAAVGLFGVMAQMVKQRSRELGIRMALGATARNVRSMVLSRGLTIAGVGIGAGIVGALLANRMLGALLYGVGPNDGVTLLIVGALILGVAAIATGIPARAGTRIDPAAALRAEE